MLSSSRIAQVYGYAVCLIAVITILIGVGNITDAAIERSNPLMADGRYSRADGSLTSFEAYRASSGLNRPGTTTRTRPDGSVEPVADTLTTEQLRARYEALRTDQLARVSFGTAQRLAKHGLLVAIALGLFVWHWRWLRGREHAEPA